MNHPNFKKWRKWALLATPLVAFLIAARALNTNPPSNSARTSPDATEAALRTRLYDVSLEDAEVATRQIVRELRSYGQPWRLPFTARADETASSRIVDVEVPVLIFVDDLTVRLEAQNGQTRVDVESKARIGRGDFGENRRHVLQLLAKLDERLKAGN